MSLSQSDEWGGDATKEPLPGRDRKTGCKGCNMRLTLKISGGEQPNKFKNHLRLRPLYLDVRRQKDVYNQVLDYGSYTGNGMHQLAQTFSESPETDACSRDD